MTPTEASLRTYPHLFIGGQWVESSSGETYRSVDPAVGEPWAEIARGDARDVDRAVAARAGSTRGPVVEDDLRAGRGALITRLAELMAEKVDSLAELESRDNGKTHRDTKGEVSRAVEWLTFFAGAADKINGATIPVRPDALAYTVREPVGVVAAITPWNSPLYLTSWKLGPALAAGNTIIVKPSSQTSVTALALAALVEESGFPDGVVNVVTGSGAVVGSALAEHRGVNKISVTGDFRDGPGSYARRCEQPQEGDVSSAGASRRTSCSRTRTSIAPWSWRPTRRFVPPASRARSDRASSCSGPSTPSSLSASRREPG